MKYLRTVLILISLAVILIVLAYGWLIPLAEVTQRTQKLNLGLTLEVIAVLFLWTLFMFITARVYTSIVLGLIFYTCFVVINLIKIKLLNAPLMPVDFTQLDDLLRTTSVISIYVPYILLFLLLMLILMTHLFKREKSNKYYRMYSFSTLVILVSLAFLQADNIRTYLAKEKMLIMKNSNLVNRFVRYGFLNFFSQALFLQTESAKPINYSQNQIERIISKHGLFKSEVTNFPENMPDNIILILAESFVDPNELGWQTSEEILVHFNELRKNHTSGHVLVPVFGGKSINTEFELLTGLSTLFTPIESLPFRELVSEHTPSIARVLKPWGFESSVIQVVPLSGFGFEKIYDYIGMRNTYSLIGDDVEKDPSGRYASSRELAQKIISITEKENKSFVYAFANSSHMPWRIEDYENNTIKLLHDHGLDVKQQQKVLAYFNGLRHVEELLTSLVAYYKKSNERTLLLFAGDHHPSMEMRMIKKLLDDDYKKYVVPAVIWSNFLDAEEIQNDFFYSMNYMASLILQMAKIEPKGFFKFNSNSMHLIKLLSPKFPLSKQLQNKHAQILKDYEMLQYKILMESGGKELY